MCIQGVMCRGVRVCVRGLCVIGHLCVVSGYACLVSHVGLEGVYKTCGLHVFRMVHVFGGECFFVLM